MKFTDLIRSITSIHSNLSQQTARAVNTALTIRNWLIGGYIFEYEQKGEDRAEYGSELLQNLAVQLKETNIKGLSYTNLNLFRQLYLTYPQILQTLSEDLINHPIIQTLSEESGQININKKSFPSAENRQKKLPEYSLKGDSIISCLSYSHLVQLLNISDPLKRTFYEIEAINGTWSLREMRRQISTLYYERSGISSNKNKLRKIQNRNSEKLLPAEIIKNPYSFEFLGIPAKDVVEEKDFEKFLINNLQHFILELGHGFCFEARQKRILIGDEYFFIDLVFYHRILKCHVLIELKVDEFKHENAGQLNAYINYFNDKVKQPSDNPAVGLLLCTGGNETLVQYATAGMDENLFVRKYLIELPSEEDIKRFIDRSRKELDCRQFVDN